MRTRGWGSEATTEPEAPWGSAELDWGEGTGHETSEDKAARDTPRWEGGWWDARIAWLETAPPQVLPRS